MGVVIDLSSRPRAVPRVRQLRAVSRMTQQQFADMLGVERETLQRWERGTERIPVAQRERLTEIFGVSVEFLMGDPL